MKLKQLLIVLGIALIGLMVGSHLLADKHGEQSFAQQPLLTDVDWPSLARIEVSQGDKKLTIEKVMQQWQVADKDGYPANTEQLSELLQSLKDAKLVELKTKLEKNYHRLGLSLADSDKQNSGLLLSLSGSTDKQTTQLVIGNQAQDGRGQYVRLLSNPQSYLIDQNLNISLHGSDWIAENLFEQTYQDVVQLSVTFSSGEHFEIHRPFEQLPENDEEETSELATKSSSRGFDFVLKSASNAAEFTQRSLQYDTIFSGLVRNVLNVKATDAQLLNETNQALLAGKKAATFTLTYLVSDEEKSKTFGLYKVVDSEKGSEQSDYYLTFEDGKYLLSVSEFNYNQLVKPLNDYYQEIDEQQE